MDLKGSSAVVTGASLGIGLAITEALIERGAQVAGWARDADRLSALGDRFGDHFHAISCDVGDLEAVGRAVQDSHKTLGRIDILVNNAGVGRFGTVDELAKDDWDEMFATNVSGVYHTIREIVPIMKEQGAGHIVNISSIAGKVGNPGLSGYNASKYAVRGLSDALFKELREFGIKVTALFPGSTETSFSTGRPGSSKNKMRPEEIAEVVAHVLERSENFLISEVVMRPLRPRG